MNYLFYSAIALFLFYKPKKAVAQTSSASVSLGDTFTVNGVTYQTPSDYLSPEVL